MPRKKPDDLAEQGFLPLSLAAKNLGISVTTLKQFIRLGKIHAIDISSSSERNEFRIPIEIFMEYLKKNQIRPTEEVSKAFDFYIRSYFPNEENVIKTEKISEKVGI